MHNNLIQSKTKQNEEEYIMPSGGTYSFANCVTLVRDDEELSFAIKAQKKRNLSTGNLKKKR